jgi:hypothetical protein
MILATGATDLFNQEYEGHSYQLTGPEWLLPANQVLSPVPGRDLRSGAHPGAGARGETRL